MSPDTFRDMLAAMTPEERQATLQKLAASMVQPKRTPCDYRQLDSAEGDDDGEV